MPTDEMTVKGTVDYMAPEMISGKGGFASYGEAADVYSLAITMWDVLNPAKEKYPSARNNHLRVFESVVAGDRPELDPLLHPKLRELLASSWHQDHWRRPSAQTIVHTLESIQEGVAAALASELHDELEGQLTDFGGAADNAGVGDNSPVLSFSGQELTSRLRSRHITTAASQGVRIGNMLMDAGLLHHVRHARSFECSSDALYFFDEYPIPEDSVLTAKLLGGGQPHSQLERIYGSSSGIDRSGIVEETFEVFDTADHQKHGSTQ
ncbi:hypothetical protein PybrP1_004851 [[Pythium] brassicae (nom. inval.)]|nr:hypothetical protein PybrP1_004851 [[Pythium] brassicae (nom. inval.)]